MKDSYTAKNFTRKIKASVSFKKRKTVIQKLQRLASIEPLIRASVGNKINSTKKGRQIFLITYKYFLG